jgi:hypothetical protein
MVSVSTLGLLTISQTVPSSGAVTIIASPNLAVFSDSQGTQPLTSVDWGSIEPGGSVLRTIYLKNTGDVPLTLTMSTEDWTPSTASNSMALSWNKQSSTLAVGQTTAAVFTLNVDSDISGITAFSVDIVISGTG